MSYAICIGTCIGCRQLFGFNPHRVPSVLVEGVREPVCAECVARVNPLRRARGLAEIVPAADAYEPVEASAL